MTARMPTSGTRRAVRLARWVLAGLLFALVLGGCGLSPAAPVATLKPAAGQTYPDSFGDRNTRVRTTAETGQSAYYKDSSGRTYTVSIDRTTLLLKDIAAEEKPATTKVYGDVYCFNVQTNPQLCQLQLDGGLLTFSSSQEWDGERIAGILHDFYAQMHA